MQVKISIAASFPFVFEMRLHNPVLENSPEDCTIFWQNTATATGPVAKWAQTL